jgi:hypothetical protein
MQPHARPRGNRSRASVPSADDHTKRTARHLETQGRCSTLTCTRARGCQPAGNLRHAVMSTALAHIRQHPADSTHQAAPSRQHPAAATHPPVRQLLRTALALYVAVHLRCGGNPHACCRGGTLNTAGLPAVRLAAACAVRPCMADSTCCVYKSRTITAAMSMPDDYPNTRSGAQLLAMNGAQHTAAHSPLTHSIPRALFSAGSVRCL